ncbi:MAG: GNAT family N-acetyltransferase [Lachnospiraceae bacterium]|nr:GNAT family N-acetyltransferase [Lachnospiraceae bacterium]
MIIEDKWFALKDGRKALLKSPGEEEVQGMLDYLKVTAGETDFLLRYPEECGKYTYESEKKLFEDLNASENDAMLACIVDGKVAGNCQIIFNKRIKTMHRASVAIALRKEYWNLGIGTVMFEEMIRIAQTRPEVLQMELEFIEGNSRARALYEKMGFRITGMHPNAIRLKDGSFRNEYQMIREMAGRRAE